LCDSFNTAKGFHFTACHLLRRTLLHSSDAQLLVVTAQRSGEPSAFYQRCLAQV
jgi:hypothetical protein